MSGRIVPAIADDSPWEVRRYHEHAGRDGVAFSADIYHLGRRVGQVADEGMGGETDYTFVTRDDEQAFLSTARQAFPEVKDARVRHHRLEWGDSVASHLSCKVCGLGWPPSALMAELLRPCPGEPVAP